MLWLQRQEQAEGPAESEDQPSGCCCCCPLLAPVSRMEATMETEWRLQRQRKGGKRKKLQLAAPPCPVERARVACAPPFLVRAAADSCEVDVAPCVVAVETCVLATAWREEESTAAASLRVLEAELALPPPLLLPSSKQRRCGGWSGERA